MTAESRPRSSESWYAARQPQPPARPRLQLDSDADVCVIGGGLAGLTAAREIAARGWSVIVLEAGRIGEGASGRNTGFVIPGFAADPLAIAARVGLEDARELWAMSERGLDDVRNTIRALRLRGADLTAGGWLHVSKRDDEARQAERVETLMRDFDAQVEHWPTARVRDVLRSPLYYGAIHHKRAFSIDPLAYLRGLAAAAEAAGAHIHEHTPATALDPDGVRKRISTPSARVRAAHVVIATNVPAGRLIPGLAETLLPVTPYVMVTAPLGARAADIIATKAAVSDTDLANNHYRLVGDRLMWSGRSTVWRGRPQRHRRALLTDLARAYPQLGPVEVEHLWSGTFGMTVHRMPQIGELRPGVWLLGGFGGHGLNTTAMGGGLIARAVVEGDRSWRLFLPFSLVFAGGATGRTVVQIGQWMHESRERLIGWRARRKRGDPQGIGTVALPTEAPQPAGAQPLRASGSPSERPPRRRRR